MHASCINLRLTGCARAASQPFFSDFWPEMTYDSSNLLVFFVFNVFSVFFIFVCSWLCQRCQGHLVVLESMGSQGLHFSTFLKEDSRGIAGCLLQSVDSHALANLLLPFFFSVVFSSQPAD